MTDYAPDARGRTEWQVNFADPHLFGMYEWALFAQDEATGPRTVDRDRLNDGENYRTARH